jgi:hypothetical protein
MRTTLNCVLAALACASCGGIPHDPRPGTTTGSIYVGAPRVSARERLVNDRREQEDWLTKQLAAADDAVFGFQGAITTATLSSMAVGAQARFDPSNGVFGAQQSANTDLIRQQGATASRSEQLRQSMIGDVQQKLANGTLDTTAALAQLQAINTQLPAASAPIAPTSASAGDFSGLNGRVATALSAASASAPTAATAAGGALTAMSVSPIDRFRDRLALRDEIRGERQKNALDDVHDLHRHTLYQLTFDTTVLPDDDTSAWSVVDVTVTQGNEANDADPDGLYQIYRRHTEVRMRQALSKYVEVLGREKEHCPEKDSQQRLSCAIKYAFTGKARDAAQQAIQEFASGDDHQKGAANLVSRQLSLIFSSNYLLSPLVPSLPSAHKVGTATQTAAAASAALAHPAASAAQAQPAASAATSRPADDLNGDHWITAIAARLVFAQFQEEGLDCFYELQTEKARDDNSREAVAMDPQDFDQLKRARLHVVEIVGLPPNDCSVHPLVDDKSTAAASFLKALRRDARPAAYAVTPRESVQTLSDVSARRDTRQLLLGLSALVGKVGIDTAVQSLKEDEVFMQAVKRQPLVVGFSDQLSGTNNHFGWILGPSFRVGRNVKGAEFRHTVRQEALSAALRVPSWWRSAHVKVTTRWQREHAGGASEASSDEKIREYDVPLPYQLAAIDGALVDGDPDRSAHAVFRYATDVRVGRPARLLLRGPNLWKATEVYLGAQPATRVTLLPDMAGLAADFAEVADPSGVDMRDAVDGPSLPIVVVTSDGFTEVGRAHIVDDGKARPRVITGLTRRFIADAVPPLVIDPPLANPGNLELWMRSPVSINSGALPIATAAEGLDLSREGTALRTTVTPAKLPGNVHSGDPVDLTLRAFAAPGRPVEDIALGSGLVYFKTAADANVKAGLKVQNVSGGFRIGLTFPVGTLAAFSALDGGKVPVSGVLTYADGTTARLAAVPCTIVKKDATGQCELTLAVPAAQAADALWAKARSDKKWSLALTFEGSDVPTIDPAAVVPVP